MTTDLSATSSEVVETNSLREITLFCAVLLVEIYSLAVSFGGPFFEVGYFLLVVISQTFAGAYIWAQLRQSDKTLPLPELLAMGFAIGSASAAISQLIIRDLLGIRLFLSPLVPIIGVAIWLVTKRDPQLPVKVTHATTNTLLWLLFPAPLAMSFFIWELYATFIIPLFLLIFLLFKFKICSRLSLTLVVCTLSIVFSIVSRITSKISIAIGLAGNDELFDEAHAIGFSNWGINENIGQVGSTFRYYKLSHIWLGPILEVTHASPMLLSTSVVTLFIFLIVGVALWATSFRLFQSTTSAGVTTIFVFIQHSLPEPFNLNIRLAQSLVLVFFVCGFLIFVLVWRNLTQELIATFAVTSVVFAMRAQYAIILISGILLHKLFLFAKKQISILNLALHSISAATAFMCIFLLFLNESQTESGAAPRISIIKLLHLLIGGLIVRAIIPLIATRDSINERTGIIFATILSSILVYLGFAQTALGDTPTLAIVLLSSFLIANEIVNSNQRLDRALLAVFILGSAFVGATLRIVYDLYKWKYITTSDDMTVSGTIVKWLVKTSTNSDFITRYSLIPYILILLIAVILLIFSGNLIKIRATILILAAGMSFGVSVATTFRPITNHFRYEFGLTKVLSDTSPINWLTDPDRKKALIWIKRNTHRDDIFAQNTSLPDTEFSSSLVMSVFTHRRAYLEAPSFGSNISDDKLTRLNTSLDFVITPTASKMENLRSREVKWFVVDLGNTPLRDWEPWATTRFMNEKVAILELANSTTLEPNN
jgi:hypothetical protein